MRQQPFDLSGMTISQQSSIKERNLRLLRVEFQFSLGWKEAGVEGTVPFFMDEAFMLVPQLGSTSLVAMLCDWFSKSRLVCLAGFAWLC